MRHIIRFTDNKVLMFQILLRFASIRIMILPLDSRCNTINLLQATHHCQKYDIVYMTTKLHAWGFDVCTSVQQIILKIDRFYNIESNIKVLSY